MTFFLCLVAQAGFAEATCLQPRSSISRITGLAEMELLRKGLEYRFEMAVRIDSPEDASFQGIDDFGNTLFDFSFQREKGKKKTVVEALLHRWSGSPKNLECRYDSQGRLVSILRNKRPKNLVLFSDFKKRGKHFYPHLIEIATKRESVRIIWKQIYRLE